MRKISNIIITIILIISIIILFYSAYHIIIWYIDNKNTEAQINAIKKITDIEYEKIEDFNIVNVDFTKLKEINDEVVAWINIPNTNVDYAVVKHNDNNYYLSHSFDKTINKSGWVFMDYRNNLNKLDDNTVFYAHGLVNGTMFGSLKNILKDEYLNKDKNHYIYVATPNTNYVFEIFSIYHMKPNSDYIQIEFDKNNYSNWLKLMKDRSLIDFDVSPKVNDKVFTLSTCYNKDERLIIHSKLIYAK